MHGAPLVGDLRLWPAGGRRAAGAGVGVGAGDEGGSKARARTVHGRNKLGGRASEVEARAAGVAGDRPRWRQEYEQDRMSSAGALVEHRTMGRGRGETGKKRKEKQGRIRQGQEQGQGRGMWRSGHYQPTRPESGSRGDSWSFLSPSPSLSPLPLPLFLPLLFKPD